MRRRVSRRVGITAGVGVAALVAAGVVVANGAEFKEWRLERKAESMGLPGQAAEKYVMIAGGDPKESGFEAFEAATAQGQFDEARTSPGVVNAGAYGAAFSQFGALPVAGGLWHDITRVPYNADDPRYRDFVTSNSSGGAGYVTGRITGLAADNSGHVYAAGANGGVFRSSTGGGNWTPISDSLPSLSSGDLVLGQDGSLWYSTGEANTGATSFVGAGVYRLANPVTGTFSPSNRVGGKELESSTIGRLRFGGGKVWAATNRGIWYHDAASSAGAWTFAFAPNMPFMPEIRDNANNVLVPAGSTTGGATNAAYKNIANDVLVDPKNPKHVIAAVGWRSGDEYNGFYETADYTTGAAGWHKINPSGAMPADDIGYVTFAWASDASKLYAINQSPRQLNKAAGTVNSYLDGIYVSNNGSVNGPWTKIADSTKLANSGSALKQSVGGKGYGPGVQAWYNQFLTVDPANPNHVYAGLEEVYETTNAGSGWNTVGPYWNFYFPCWDISDSKNTCPLTTHSDQHSVAIGSYQGKTYVYAGNDGGLYRRPLNGAVNSSGHATDWQSLTTDGTIDALQYYSVSVGADTSHGGFVVSGGLQDNGVSNLFGVKPNGSAGEPVMGSNFGGDGGDGFAHPSDGCKQVQEYVLLSVSLTTNCNQTDGSTPASVQIAPPDSAAGLARFIAPVSFDQTNPDSWIAGGQHVWTQTKGWAIKSGSEWTSAFDLGAGHLATAVATVGGVSYAAWCGPCNNNGFARGVATNAGGTWHQLTLPGDGSVLPNRYLSSLAVDKTDSQHVLVAVNGFSRKFTEGPGAGVGHLYESTDGGATWTDLSGSTMPDVPANSVVIADHGALVVGTDLGVLYRAPGATAWQRLGSGLPTTVALKVLIGSDGNVYAATHGRGIWCVPLP